MDQHWKTWGTTLPTDSEFEQEPSIEGLNYSVTMTPDLQVAIARAFCADRKRKSALSPGPFAMVTYFGE